jgi:hypothetical protein
LFTGYSVPRKGRGVEISLACLPSLHFQRLVRNRRYSDVDNTQQRPPSVTPSICLSYECQYVVQVAYLENSASSKQQVWAGQTANIRTSVLFIVNIVNNKQYTQSSVLKSSPTHPWHGLPEVLSRMSRLSYLWKSGFRGKSPVHPY